MQPRHHKIGTPRNQTEARANSRAVRGCGPDSSSRPRGLHICKQKTTTLRSGEVADIAAECGLRIAPRAPE
eukprot:12801601-Alexandrium_andersonii.AAC.1